MSRWRLVTFFVGLLLLVGAAPAAAHDHGMGGPGAGSGAAGSDGFRNMTLLESDPAPMRCRDAEDRGAFVRCITSDIAFWGNYAVVGNYGGFRIYDISNPENPQRITDFGCYGPQNDPSLWDTTPGDGRPDLLVLSVDRTLRGPREPGPGCDPVEPVALQPHDDPSGWEGIRVFDISNLANPVLVNEVYQDCGSHTNTLYKDPDRNRLIVLNSSYPLRPGPTCGPVNGPANGRNPLHGVIQIVQIDLLGNATTSGQSAREIEERPINYPGDPDNKFDPDEHGRHGFNDLRACHDIAVYLPRELVVGACAEQSQMWRFDAQNLPVTTNPVWVFDRRNIDFHHSATLTWDSKLTNIIDESFGSGCPTVTKGVGQTGRMFFLDTDTGRLISHFMIRRHKKEVPDYCSAHLGNFVPSSNRYLLVNAWYTGGVDVIDVSHPRSPREVAFWDTPGDNWSAYWYEQDGSSTSGPLNVFGTHGVEEPNNSLGFQAFVADVAANRRTLDHLNPQVQELAVPANVSKAARRSSRLARSARASRSRTARSRSSGRVSQSRVTRHLAPAR